MTTRIGYKVVSVCGGLYFSSFYMLPEKLFREYIVGKTTYEFKGSPGLFLFDTYENASKFLEGKSWPFISKDAEQGYHILTVKFKDKHVKPTPPRIATHIELIEAVCGFGYAGARELYERASTSPIKFGPSTMTPKGTLCVKKLKVVSD